MDDNLSNLPDAFETVFMPAINESRRLHTFQLLALPPELWLRICQSAVTQSDTMDLTRARTRHHQARMVQQPALTRTCRLLRREALPMFYRGNDFAARHLGGVACVREWFPAIGPENCRTMGTFVFHAMFEPQFWVKQFEQIGLEVKVEVAEDQSKCHPNWTFKTLVIRF